MFWGPAQTKMQFEKRINEDKNITSKLKKIETSDSMTENQIVAKVKKIFKL